jgi:MFS family permease
MLAGAQNGVAAGFLWVAQGTYINNCASDSNKGFYNSIFLLCTFGFAYILGNILATYIIKLLSEVYLFIILTVLSSAVTLYLCFMKAPRPHKCAEDEDEEIEVE